MNMLIPVINKEVAYPVEITSTMTLVETTTGALKTAPGSPYILRFSFEKENDFASYSLLEKKLKKYSEMVIALVKGSQRRQRLAT